MSPVCELSEEKGIHNTPLLFAQNLSACVVSMLEWHHEHYRQLCCREVIYSSMTAR